MTDRANERDEQDRPSLPAIAENLLELKAVALANDSLLMQLVWILLGKGVLANAELIAAIDASITSNRRLGTVDGQGAAVYLEQIKSMVQAGDSSARSH